MGIMEHSENDERVDQGENLMGGPYCKLDGMQRRACTLMEAAQEASDMWYDEIKHFDWNGYSRHSGVVGHFTQV